MTIGFQGSNTTRVEVTIYPQKRDEPVTFSATSPLPMNAVDQAYPLFHDPSFNVVSVQTSKIMGAASGTFSINLKSPLFDVRELFVDDDWVDIVFTKNGKPCHVMRGLIDYVERARSAKSGATETVYSIHGRDFGKIFEQQIVWFDAVTKGNWAAAAASRMWVSNFAFANGSVFETVRTLLRGMLLPNSQEGAGMWDVPSSVPAQFASFIDNVKFLNKFSNIPSRGSGLNPTLFDTGLSTVWSVMEAWSDPMLVDVYTDLIRNTPDKKGFYIENQAELTRDDTQMAVIIRDKPFPNTVRDVGNLMNAPYFTDIPTYEIEPQDIDDDRVGRGGAERRNSFFFAPALIQELAPGFIDMQLPLVHVEDVKRHGMRIMDATSGYLSDKLEKSYLGMHEDYRTIVRDYHCLNHLFLKGTMTLTSLRPDIRIGGRLRVNGRGTGFDLEDSQETYYVEGVSNVWTLSKSATSLTLTRGWRGGDDTHVDALQQRIAEYAVQSPATPGETTAGEGAPAADAKTEDTIE